MALYYDLGALLQHYNNDNSLVREKLIDFLEVSKHSLEKIKEGIDEKSYSRVQKHINKLIPFLEYIGMDQALDETKLMNAWTIDQGKTKEVKEIFKSFKIHVKDARKEIKKDFNL